MSLVRVFGTWEMVDASHIYLPLVPAATVSPFLCLSWYYTCGPGGSDLGPRGLPAVLRTYPCHTHLHPFLVLPTTPGSRMTGTKHEDIHQLVKKQATGGDKGLG